MLGSYKATAVSKNYLASASNTGEMFQKGCQIRQAMIDMKITDGSLVLLLLCRWNDDDDGSSHQSVIIHASCDNGLTTLTRKEPHLSKIGYI